MYSKSDEKNEKIISESKKETFRYQIRALLKYSNPESKKLLDIGTGKAFLLEIANELGFDCYGLDISKYAVNFARKKFPDRIFEGTLEQAKFENEFFDVVALTDVIEHISDINSLVAEIRRILKPNGLVFVISPHTGSISHKILKTNWFQYKFEHIIYFNLKSIKFLLNKYGFKIQKFKHNTKKLSLAYYDIYFRKYSIFPIDKIFKVFFKHIPNFLKYYIFLNPLSGEFLAIARKS